MSTFYFNMFAAMGNAYFAAQGHGINAACVVMCSLFAIKSLVEARK